MTKSTRSSPTLAESLAPDLAREVLWAYYQRDAARVEYVITRHLMNLNSLPQAVQRAIEAHLAGEDPAQPEGEPSPME
jgi:hypothetical protein